MAPLPQRVRDEHRELLTHNEIFRTVTDSIGIVTAESIREGVSQAYSFLIHQLIPHAQAEEQVLYPGVGSLLHALEVHETMSRDHIEVMRLSEEQAGVASYPLWTLCDHQAASCQRGGDLSPHSGVTIAGFGSE